jgi:uroporphyrinogen decarboxylase
MHDEMTGRERVREALAHRETDRVPFSWGFGINAPCREKLREYLGISSMRHLDAYLASFRDMAWIYPEYRGPSDRNKRLADGSFIDLWGVARKPVSYGEGYYDEISHYPLGGITDLSELDRFGWPQAEWTDAAHIGDQIRDMRKESDIAVIVGNGNIFETSWYMRGFENMLYDLIMKPELAWGIMTRVTDYFIGYFKRILEAAEGEVDIVFTADDIGQQEGPLVSPKLWEAMIKPHHERLNKAIHEYGVKIMYHTDGSVMDMVSGLIGMGIDILEALQFDAKGMDPSLLKTQYGDRLCFHGGVSVQKTLPFGSPESVRDEVRERIRVLGKDGGYILAPSHAIQAGTPPENIAAFIEASGQNADVRIIP